MKADYYELLGVARTCNAEELKKSLSQARDATPSG